MYFSKIRLRKGISPRDITKLTKINGYKAHQLAWNFFADHPDRQRDFIYRHESAGRWPIFYTVSHRMPVNNTGFWEVQTKEYRPQLKSGQKLEFSIRVNPIRTRHNEKGKQKRHDVVMEEKLRLKNEGKDFNLPEIAHEQGFQWMEKRSESYGFSLSSENIRIDGYRQQKYFRGKGNHPITFSTLDFNGILTVIRPEVFIRESLFNGIGPAKAFGCGLMLVKRL